MRFLIINKLIVLLFVFFNLTVISQDLDAVRLEVPSDIDAEAFHVETIDNDGLLIFYVSNELDDEKKRKWYFALFDTGLNQTWLKFVPLADNIEYITSKRVNDNVYLLFKNIGRERSDYGYYEIVTYNTNKQDFSKISGAIPSKAEYAGFDIIDKTACLALNLKKHATDLVFINLTNGDLTPVHIDEETPGFIESLYADKVNKNFYVAIKQNKDRRYISENIMVYSPTGKRLINTKIANTESLKYFVDYVFVLGKRNIVSIFGTYRVIGGKNVTFKDLEEDVEDKSAGMYFLKFVNNKQESLNYYDFMGFDHISGAIGPDDFVTTKINDDSISRANHMVSASFSLNKPQVYKSTIDKFVFSVEVFKPYYKTETRMDYDFNGRPYPYTYNVFSGYNFYDVIVAEVSSNGFLEWSNDFPIEDMLTFSTSRKSVVFSDENLVSLAYVNNGNVISQTIDGSLDIVREKMKIGTDFPQDRVTDEENSHIVHWYEDYFLIFGYQKLNNRTLGEQSTRTVFYANKIAYK